MIQTIYKTLTSSIGRKYIMAITGLALLGFVIVHMLGNWEIFGGPDHINHYAYILKHNSLILWTFRSGLLLIALLHVVTAISLVIDNKKARPVNYEKQLTMQATVSSLTMAVSGSFVLVFIIFHLLHFTTMTIFPEYKNFDTYIVGHGIFQAIAPVQEGVLYHDVHRMIITAFTNPWISAFYVLSMGLLAFHLSHGISSLFQTLGLRSKATEPFFNWLARGISLIIFFGMSAIPMSVLLKLVR
jgi:succinate dehydrogenase / fumarate reductase cytochrome b subunit